LLLELDSCSNAISLSKEKLNSELITLIIIKITKTISCESKTDCEINFDNLKTEIILSGFSSEAPTFKRVGDDFSYSIFNITNSENIKFRNLVFDEGDGSVCKNGGCQPTINISSSQGIYLESIKISGAKESGVKITNSGQIGISNSQIINSFKNAVQVTTDQETKGVLLDGNLFENNGSNAIVFSAKSTVKIPSLIKNNTFSKNHSKGVYSECTYPCAAGQILIRDGTENLAVQNNKIRGGSSPALDILGLYPSGIELSSTNTKNIDISCNTVTQNKGSGIVQTGTESTINISVNKNELVNNGINLNLQKAASLDNCFNEKCATICSR